AQYRLITGNTRDVISKLADSLYDLFVIRDFEDLLESVDQGFRALRPGGILLIDSALGGGKVADPTQRDPITISRRETIKSIKETDDRWEPMLLPLGEGVLVATKLN
ncbi:MAG: methyltransferase, partial [Actinobacteria bacterium]|nr:methyltransferase [Actinomycetota bacterium]